MDEVAGKLLAAITVRETHARWIHRDECGYERIEFGTGDCSCGQPNDIRRRCAADREIVAACRRIIENHAADDVTANILAEKVLALMTHAYSLVQP